MDCDYLVIGAGVCGLASALSLKLLRPRKSVVLIERDEMHSPFQASVVNSGILSLGETTTDSLMAVLEAGTVEMYARLSNAHDVEFAKLKSLELATKKDSLSPSYITSERLFEVEPKINRPNFGAYLVDAAVAHPLKTMRALHKECESRGCVVLERVEARLGEFENNRWAVDCRHARSEVSDDPDFTMRAKTVVVAGGALSSEILEDYLPSDCVTPVLGQMFECLDYSLKHVVSTRKSYEFWKTHDTLPPKLTHQSIIGSPRLTDHLYAKPTREGRVLIGGDRRKHPRQTLRAQHPLPRLVESAENRAHADEVFEGLPGTDRVWAGVMPFSSDGLPVLGELLPHLYVCTGLGAVGFMTGGMAGALVASAAVGDVVDILERASPKRFLSESL